MRVELSVAGLLALLALSACGGGGGGDSGGGGSGGGESGNPPGPSVQAGDFTLSASSVAFDAQVGKASPAAQTVTAHLLDTKSAALGAAYVSPQVPPDWLNVSITGSAPDYVVTFTATSTAKAQGTYSTVVTLGTADAAGTVLRSKPVNVTLVVGPASALRIPPRPIVVGGVDGYDRGPAALSFFLNTSGSAAWSASTSTQTGGNWLTLNTTSGTLDAEGTTVWVNADRSVVPAGRYEGTITLTAVVGGATVTENVPVVFNKEFHRLHVSAHGTAFSKFPSSSMLTRTLTVTSNQDRSTVPWTAASNRSWLTVTPSGTTGGSLTLSANPALSPGQFDVATVTISSPDPSIDNQEHIRVALWADAGADPQPVSLGVQALELLMNPVEPWVYAHSRGSSISVYNVYTGALVTTLNAGVTTASTMAISDDGTELYVMDSTNGRVVAMNAATGVERRRISYSTAGAKGLAVIRPDAHPILAVATGELFDVETGTKFATRLGSITAPFYENLRAGPVPRYLYGANAAYTSASVYRYTVRYSGLVDDRLSASSNRASASQTDARDLCLSPDGARVFVANLANGYTFKLVDAESMLDVSTLPGNAYPTNAECGWNGLYLGAADQLFPYRADGTAIGSPISLGFPVSALALSGDNTRYVASNGSNQLLFRDAPRP